jgi:hypothetical protein
MMPVMSHDLRFKHPFSCITSGPSGSGKSSFCISFLQNFDTLCTEPNFDGGILWYNDEKNAIPSQQLASIDAVDRVQYHEGVPENFLNDVSFIVSYKSRRSVKRGLFERGVPPIYKGIHHRIISIILITQNLFHQGRYCRDISLNTKYLVLLKNVRDKNQFSHLARQFIRRTAPVCTRRT